MNRSGRGQSYSTLQRIHDVIKNAEWYACCLPEPSHGGNIRCLLLGCIKMERSTFTSVAVWYVHKAFFWLVPGGSSFDKNHVALTLLCLLEFELEGSLQVLRSVRWGDVRCANPGMHGLARAKQSFVWSPVKCGRIHELKDGTREFKLPASVAHPAYQYCHRV